VLDATTPEDAAAIMRRMRDLALTADPAVAIPAARVYFERTLGKAADPVEVDRLDLDELKLMLLRPFALEIILHGLDAVGADQALAFLKAAAEVKGAEAIGGKLNTDKVRLLDDLRRAAVLGRAKGN
jgi:hypothetical protein